MSHNFHFGDMPWHLANVDLQGKKYSLSEQQQQDEYFIRNPTTFESAKQVQWPMVAYHVAGLLSSHWGPLSIWTTQLTNLLFSLVMIGGVVLLGGALGSLRAGLWGALFTVLCPALVASSWYFSLDYCMGAMVPLGLYLLLKTRGFSSLVYSLAFAVWCGLAMNVKVSFGLYLLAPTLLALFLGRGDSHSRGSPLRVAPWRVALSVLASLCLFSFVFFLLYPSSLQDFFTIFWDHLKAPVPDPQLPTRFFAPLTWRWIVAIPRFAADNYPLPLLLLALPGLVLLHLRGRRAVPYRWLSLGFVWGIYVLFTLIANKFERYVQPAYPVLCLLTAWWIIRLIGRRWQTTSLLWVATAFAAVLGLAQLRPTPWGLDKASHRWGKHLYEFSMPGVARLDRLRTSAFHPDCYLEPLYDHISALLREDDSTQPVGFSTMGTMGNGLLLNQSMLYLIVAQAARNRFVIGLEYQSETGLSPMLRDVPSLLMFHPPGADVRATAPSFHPVARRTATIWCGGENIPLAVSLLGKR